MVKLVITDSICYSLARLVDDSQGERRDPSHSDIQHQILRSGISEGDPNREGLPVGKEKRVRSVLSWAMNEDMDGAEKFVRGLISFVISCGGFRESSQNFVGFEAIENLANAFKETGIVLSAEGALSAVSLEGLAGRELTEALQLYVVRAKKGAEDAALLVGTSKDLMEAVAAHIVQELFGVYTYTHFPMLMGQAFTALEMNTQDVQAPSPQQRLEKSMYELACSINNLRNKEGVGHGRPWLPNVSGVEARASIEFMGVISEILLSKLALKQT